MSAWNLEDIEKRIDELECEKAKKV